MLFISAGLNPGILASLFSSLFLFPNSLPASAALVMLLLALEDICFLAEEQFLLLFLCFDWLSLEEFSPSLEERENSKMEDFLDIQSLFDQFRPDGSSTDTDSSSTSSGDLYNASTTPQYLVHVDLVSSSAEFVAYHCGKLPYTMMYSTDEIYH